jgi:lipopolysaccharide transport system permease protein
MASTATATSPHAIRIRPPSRGSGAALSELWEHRELLYFLTKRELQIRYNQSVLGIGWAIVQPLALTFIFALFFGKLAKIPSEGIPFPVFALAGLTPWLFVAASVNGAANSLVSDADLLSKVYFPRMVLPLAKMGAHMIDLGVSFLALIGFTLAYGISLSATALLTPLFLVLAVMTAAAVGILSAALNVRYRDVVVVIPVAVQIWLFMTPVVYPGSLVTGPLQYLYAANPMVSAINGVRWSFLGAQAPGLGELAISVGAAALMLLTAVVYFRRSELYFADVI